MASTEPELPFDVLQSRYADDDDEDVALAQNVAAQPPAVNPAPAGANGALAADPAAGIIESDEDEDDGEDEGEVVLAEEDEDVEDEDELAEALEWADMRDGEVKSRLASPPHPHIVLAPGYRERGVGCVVLVAPAAPCCWPGARFKAAGPACTGPGPRTGSRRPAWQCRTAHC